MIKAVFYVTNYVRVHLCINNVVGFSDINKSRPELHLTYFSNKHKQLYLTHIIPFLLLILYTQFKTEYECCTYSTLYWCKVEYLCTMQWLKILQIHIYITFNCNISIQIVQLRGLKWIKVFLSSLLTLYKLR